MTKKSKKAGIIITAAGMSKRMKRFKPLLPLGDKCLIDHVIENAGIDEITQTIVIIGNRSIEMKEHLLNVQKRTGRKITLVENPAYASTDMFHSIRVGMEALDDSLDAFFVIPADMPLVRKSCYKILLNRFACSERAKVVQPRHNGHGGHPILISMECRDAILAYTGKEGLRGALCPFADDFLTVKWFDSTVLTDADHPEDYDLICRVFRRKKIPGRRECLEILEANHASGSLIAHCLQVEKAAVRIAREAARKGYSMDLRLVSAAALLHDVRKGDPAHAAAGAALLRDLGYPEVADIVAEHMRISEEACSSIDERAVVYLADKISMGSREVTLEERFGEKKKLYADNPEALENIQRNLERAEALMDALTRPGTGAGS